MVRFEEYLKEKYGKTNATTSFTFVYVPPANGDKARFTILNAAADVEVKTVWEVSGNLLTEIPTYNPSYASPTTTTTI